MRKLLFAVTLLLAVCVLVACNGAAVLNGITPSSSFERERDVAYGNDERNVMDIYLTESPKADAPVLVFVHGGSWAEGDKGLYKFIGDAFAMSGYDVVIPNYRLYPEASYATLMSDMSAMVGHVGESFPRRPMVLMGHSAGGYNVLQAVFEANVLGAERCSRVAGIVSLAGPTGAYELTDEPFITIFPKRFRGDDAPLQLAKAGVRNVPKLLLINGGDDTTVGPLNAVQLGEIMGERAVVQIYEGRDHIDVVRLLSRHFDEDASLKGNIVSFIDSLPKTGPYCSAG